jgi:hypothetical protein
MMKQIANGIKQITNRKSKAPSVENRKFPQSAMLIVILIVLSFSFFGCGGDSKPQQQQQPKRSSTQTPDAPPVDTNDYTLKGAVEYCKTGQFRYIFAFKRTDGQALTTDDKTYLKANAPIEVSYWLKADNGVYAIACTNFPFKDEHFDALKKRFIIEDHSEKK